MKKIIDKIVDVLIWLVVAHIGRLVLGFILLLTALFSEDSTVEFLKTGWAIFEYLYIVGAVIFGGQCLVLISAGVYYSIKQAYNWAKTKWKF